MPTKQLIVAACMLVSVSAVAADLAASYVGRVLPRGHGILEAYTLGNAYTFEAIREDGHEIWLLTSLESNQVVAAMQAPKLPPGHAYIRGMCTTNDPADTNESKGHGGSKFIAAVKYDRGKEKFTGADVHSAWFVDTNARKFQQRSTTGITCGNESYHLK